MKISQRLLLMVLITGFGYLALTLSFNQIFSETLKKNEVLSDIQSIQNGLKLIRLETRFDVPSEKQHNPVGEFTRNTIATLDGLSARLPASLQSLAGQTAEQLKLFSDTYGANESHRSNLNTLMKRFKSHSNEISKAITRQYRSLETSLTRDAGAITTYITLQQLNQLVSRYNNLTTEALLLDRNIPMFQANRYLFERKINSVIATLDKPEMLSQGITTSDISQEIQGWIELSQRISIELQQKEDTALRLNIVEETITKSLIELETRLKEFIETNLEKTSRDYKYATIGLLIIMMLITIMISRSIFIPLQRLLAFSHSLASGNLDAQLSGLPRGEFQELSNAFNRMAAAIKETRNELEEKVRVRTKQLQESNRTLTEEVSARKKVENILYDLATTVFTQTGEHYFSSLTRYLTTRMGYDFAIIGQLVVLEGKRFVRTLSFAERGMELPSMDYKLDEAPCELVVDKRQYFFPQNLQHLFPQDEFVCDNKLQSYVGVPISDSSGRTLGLVSVLSRSRTQSPEPVLSILQILVSQVGAEILRIQKDNALKISEERNRMLVEFAPEAIVIMNMDSNCFVLANRNAIKLFGIDRDQLYQMSPADVSPEVQPNGLASAPQAMEYLQRAMNGEHPVFEWQHKSADGTLVDCEIRLDRFPSDEAMLIRGSITNIQERKRTEAEMRKLSSALAQAGDAAIVTDRDGMIEYVNHACERITGYTRSELVGKTPAVLKSGRMEPEFYRNLWSTISQGETFSDIFINQRKDGSVYYEEKTITPLLNDNREIISYISTGKDITDRIQTEERLHHLAYHDPLTDLPNRLMLLERIDHAISNASRHQQRLAVMFLDLDRFKNINDTLGHDIGDALLQQIAVRIGKIVRSSDTFSRLGGDEFAILVETLESAAEAATIAGKILQSMAGPFAVEGQELFTSASIGISLFPDNGDSARVLVKNADSAMYRAKEQGRNCYQFYSTELTTKAYERLSIENKLRRALENNEFELFYQPQVLRPANIAYGLEALLRWRDPERGLISPAEFIPVLEETGMIIPVGEWVLTRACQDLQAWRQHSSLPLVMAVNLSGKQFEDTALAEKIRTIMNSSGTDPKLLKLEITESTLMIDPGRSARLLRSLADTGIRFAIDDFGTGYSSLSYLKQFPISTLKIDRSFVKDITVDPDDAAIVNAIIALAQNLNLDVIAEGVENLSQVKYLEQFQCFKIQGFLYSRPLPRDECFDFLLKNQGVIEP